VRRSHDAGTEAYDFRGRTLVDTNREKVGTIDDVYTDATRGQPEWALVHDDASRRP